VGLLPYKKVKRDEFFAGNVCFFGIEANIRQNASTTIPAGSIDRPLKLLFSSNGDRTVSSVSRVSIYMEPQNEQAH
jgi:hypothetical protein